jgi:hypothetical protein
LSSRPFRGPIPAALLPIALFIAHAALFTGWIVDDAAISLAYSRNLAAGHGLVAQPGDPPVEGFANALWVLVFAALYAVRLVNPLVTPKLVSGTLIALSYFLAHRTLAVHLTKGGVAAIFALCLASAQTAFVVWCVSGLENPLYVFLLVALLARVLDSNGGARDATIAGGLAGLAALTRPDGILYAVVYPVWAVVTRERRTAARLAAISLAATALLVGAYEVFRVAYFGDPFPNPYYAKGGPDLHTVLAIASLAPDVRGQIGDLFKAALGPVGLGAAAVICLAGIGSMFRRALGPVHFLLVMLTVISLGSYLLLPLDWMAEFRYATPFFLFLYLTLATIVVSLSVGQDVRKRVVLGVAAVAVAFSVCKSSLRRTQAFVSQPTISLTEVSDRVAQFRELGAVLGVPEPTLLIADVGGTLLENGVRTIDLGMLTNRDVARWLGGRSDKPDLPAFHAYIFEQVRPTFISTRAYHTWRARLDLDPRFAEDYVPLVTYADDWIRKRVGIEMISGDYVRRDVVRAAGLRIEELQARWQFR